jgi:hypothetical protein
MIRIQVVGMMIFEANENMGIRTITVWWFGTMEFYDFPYIGNSHPN